VGAALRVRAPDIWHSVSATTRAKRPGEVDRYGTPRGPVQEKLQDGIPVLLEIELQGARQVRTIDPEALLVFLAPPSWEELERRLRGRGTEDPEVIARRLAQAKVELAAEGEFDEVIVNTSIAEAAAALEALIR
jgi:guanylate kinase